MALFGVIVAYKGFKSDDPDSVGFAVIFMLVAIASIVVIVWQCSDIITANTIPEKMIYEYLNNSIS